VISAGEKHILTLGALRIESRCFGCQMGWLPFVHPELQQDHIRWPAATVLPVAYTSHQATGWATLFSLLIEVSLSIGQLWFMLAIYIHN
jgi:hypothetical protein